MSIVSSLERSLATKINFNDLNIQSYGRNRHNQSLDASIFRNGDALSLKGNGFKKVDFQYKITDKTVLEFSFKSDGEGFRHGIGFDNNNRISWKKIFHLYGTKPSRLSKFNNYGDTSGKWKLYQIPVGQFFTGNVSYLTFANQQGDGDITSRFKDIKIYEGTARTVKRIIRMIDSPPPPPPTFPVEVTVPEGFSGSTIEDTSDGSEALGASNTDSSAGLTEDVISPSASSTVVPEPSNAGLPSSSSINNAENGALVTNPEPPTTQEPLEEMTGDITNDLEATPLTDNAADPLDSVPDENTAVEVGDPIEDIGLATSEPTVSQPLEESGPGPDDLAPARDPLKQPFSSTSIWNMPIGSNAQYVDAQLEWLQSAVVDEDHFYVLDSDDPLQPLLNPGTWGPGRGTGTEFRNIALPVADDLVVPDATDIATRNNASAFLMPNGRTLVQANPLSRDRPGGFVSGYRSPDQDIYGEGIRGGHAGSGLSSIGGTIRKGELTSDEPIRHALKVNLPAKLTLSYSQGQNGGLGYRWPAVRADLYANPQTYGGSVPGLMMGSLLALPPDATPESLGIETEVGRKLFHAFQDYGAYVADDVLAEAYAIEMEHGVTTEIEDAYGYELYGWDNYKQGDLYEDYMRLFTSLHIIENNGPDNLGGGGTPRVELAPELDDSGYPLFEGTRDDDTAIGNDAPDTMYGESGKDRLEGNGGSDFIEGGEGNDTISGGADNDHLFGENGADQISGGDGNDYVDGGWWHDHIDGGAGDDMLSGWQGNDIIDGGEGFDTLVESLSQYFSDADFTLTNTKLTGSGIDQLTSIEHAILLGGRW